MKTIRYQGQNVYTSAQNVVKPQELESATVRPGRIVDAYLFQLTSDRLVGRTPFNRELVEKFNQGLYVEVKVKNFGEASVAIAGLDRILEFLEETESMGELTSLKGREVKTYSSGMQLLGIAVDPKQKATKRVA